MVLNTRTITASLDPAPAARLAAVRAGPELRLRRHPFFDGLDWLRLELRELAPPTVPKLRGPLDAHCFGTTAAERAMASSLAWELPWA